MSSLPSHPFFTLPPLFTPSCEFKHNMIGFAVIAQLCGPFRSGLWISRIMCTKGCKSVRMSAASVRAEQSYWVRWCGQCHLCTLRRTATVLRVYYVMHLLLFLISKSKVAVTLEQHVPSCLFIDIFMTFEGTSNTHQPMRLFCCSRIFLMPVHVDIGKGALEQDHRRHWVLRKNKERQSASSAWCKWLIGHLLLPEGRGLGKGSSTSLAAAASRGA